MMTKTTSTSTSTTTTMRAPRTTTETKTTTTRTRTALEGIRTTRHSGAVCADAVAEDNSSDAEEQDGPSNNERQKKRLRGLATMSGRMSGSV
jgi:hypothetical protein